MHFLRLLSSLVLCLLALAANAQTISPSSFSFNNYFLGLPAADNLAAEDQVYVNQNGISKRATLSQVAALFGIILPDIDLNFENSIYLGRNCISSTACLTATNNGGYAQWADGHWSLFPSNTARITDLGLLYETTASTNLLLYARDLTNAAWTKTNVTAALTATGIDNSVNAATTLTATSGNGTVCQTVTASNAPFGEFTFSVFVKRISGSGEIDILMDTPPNQLIQAWKPVTAGADQISNSTWKRFRISYDTMTNPTVCIRIVTSGNSIAVDFGQLEARLWPTSPILTTSASATRNPDAIAFTNAADTLINSGAMSVVVDSSGANAGNFRHQISSPFIGGGTATGYLWQYAAMAMFFNDGSEGSGNPPYAICGDINLIADNQSMALSAVWGFGWDNNGFVQACDGGTLSYGTASIPTSQTWYVGTATNGPTSYVKRIRLFGTKLNAPFLQSLTAHTNQVQIADQSPTPPNAWANYSAATTFPATVGGTLPPFSGGPTQTDYGFESGLKISGVTGPIQLGTIGNLIRFNMFANNCWANDFCQIGTYGGSERTELDGSTGAGGTAQFANQTTVWMSFSICFEPGAESTANWFWTGQIHPVSNSAIPFSISTKIGEFTQIQWVNNGVSTLQTGGTFSLVRGKWLSMVLQINLDTTGAQGVINVWKDGVQIVNYTGVTGSGAPQNYYFKFGVYRGQSPEYAAVRYANMTYSTSSLAAKIASPDPIPSGYGTVCQ